MIKTRFLYLYKSLAYWKLNFFSYIVLTKKYHYHIYLMNVAGEKGFITFSVLKAANTKYNLLEKALFKKGGIFDINV